MPGERKRAEHVIGIDFGGTKIYSGVFNAQSVCVGTARIKTKSERGVGAVIERIARCAREALAECRLDLDQIRGVGIGAPGSIDRETGTVLFAPNLGWKDVPLQKELQAILGVPVVLENDCNLSLLGVYEAEFQAKPREMAGIFVGTGIGGGFIIHGKPYTGFSHAAGEIGHMVLSANGPLCGCGNHGCFEALASRSALFRQIQSAVKEGQETVLTEMLGQDLDDLRSGDLRKAIRKGDRFVARLVDEAAMYIGIAVGNVINLLNPELVVLGGGLIEALEEEMMKIIVKTARDHAMPGTMKGVSILASKLADEAGITGGAVLARRETESTAGG